MDPQPKPKRSKRGCIVGCGLVGASLIVCVGLSISVALGLVSLPAKGIVLGTGSGNGLRISVEKYPVSSGRWASDIGSSNIDYGSGHDATINDVTFAATRCDYTYLHAGQALMKIENCAPY